MVWSTAAGVTLCMAAVHLMVWLKDRRALASLVFVVTALAAAGHSVGELTMMFAATPAQWGQALRWLHVASFFGIAGSVLFLHFYLGTGRRWLAGLIIGMRAVTLLVNFLSYPNINYREILSLRHIHFLGEQIAIQGEVVVRPWMAFAQFAHLLWLVYAIDAGVTLWRRDGPGDRRRSLMVGGSTALFMLLGAGHTVLALNGVIASPVLSSIPFLCLVLALGYELGNDVLHANRLARDLHVSESRLSLAASASGTVLWEWRAGQDFIWASSAGRMLFGIPSYQHPSFAHFSSILHPDDRDDVLRTMSQAAESCGAFAIEYRIMLPDGAVRWIASSGTAEHDDFGNKPLLRGVSLDISERRLAQDEITRQRDELAHLSRVSALGELSGSLAHELSQPLGAILRNAETAEIFLQNPKPDLEELRAIVADIRQDDLRAGEVIERMRALLKRQPARVEPLQVPELISRVHRLVRVDAAARKVGIEVDCAEGLPPVNGDRVQLQQVLLNLLMNAMDAMKGALDARISIRARRDDDAMLSVTVSDNGPGIPEDRLGRILDPFFTTKPAGLGLGLAITRGIVEAHGGSLTAGNLLEGGASFRFSLPMIKT